MYLFLYISFSGTKSYREAGGSWFVQSFCKILRKYAASKSLREIMTHTTREVAKIDGVDAKGVALKQVPDIRHDSTTKEIRFCPKGI